MQYTEKGKRKVQGVPQSQTAALPRPPQSFHFGFPIDIMLAIFTYTSTCCYIVRFKLIRLVVCEMSKTDFQDGDRGGHLGFQINTILANFDPEIVLLLQSKFQLISIKCLVTVVENGFSRWRP